MVEPLQAFYSDCFVLPLPERHRFPISKYARLREHLASILPRDRITFCVPPAATDEQLLRVHSATYLDKVKAGNLSDIEERRIGFPWSPAMVERSRRSTGATLQAAHEALRTGVAVNLAGGTHHAFADHGQGYCVFNDVAVAIRHVQASSDPQQFVVVDCDVHQGNGTAAIFSEDDTVTTCSLHGANNYPFAKCESDIDVPLPDGTDDDAYLAALQDCLQLKLDLAAAEMMFYVAGADPFHGDRLGRLALTKEGLRRRDAMVVSACLEHELPLVITMAGGYADDVQDIVDIHANTVMSAMQRLTC